MYVIEKKGKTEWFRIWSSEDGHDTADYLETCVLNDTAGEYRMTYLGLSPAITS